MVTWKQIKDGLGKEAAEHIKLSMGEVSLQNYVVEAMNNMMDTWNKLFDLAGVKDENAILETFERYENGKPDFTKPIKGGVCDPTSSILRILNYCYQQESFLYKELNRSSRFKDRTKLETLGPFAWAFMYVIGQA